MFSHWTEAYPCRQATASSVAKILLEKIISTWGTTPELQWLNTLTGLCCLAGFTLSLSYHPQSSGLV